MINRKSRRGKSRSLQELAVHRIERKITCMISASDMQLHPNCKVTIDEDADRELKEREYYDWIFQNEPEWQEFRA